MTPAEKERAVDAAVSALADLLGFGEDQIRDMLRRRDPVALETLRRQLARLVSGRLHPPQRAGTVVYTCK